MSRKKASKPARKNSNQHQRTVADPNIQANIDNLRLKWNDFDPIERGAQLRKLVGCGCSKRGLGDALEVRDSTIRRHMTLADLPEQVREAVRGGFSAKKILEYKAQADRQTRRKRRIALDKETGELSDHLADTILAFCRSDGGVTPNPIDEQYLAKFLSEVRKKCSKLEEAGFCPPKLLKHHNMKERFRLTKPKVRDDVAVNHLIEWLAILILAEIAEGPIWETAIEKPEKRSKEVIPIDTRTPVQKHMDYQAERLRRKITSPPRRRY